MISVPGIPAPEMEREGLVHLSQRPATFPCSEPNVSNASASLRPVLVFSFRVCLGFRSDVFASCVLTNTVFYLFSIYAM